MSFLTLQSPSPRRRSSFTSQRSPSATRRVNRGSQWMFFKHHLKANKKQRGSLISCDFISQSYDIQSLQLVLSSGEWRELRTEVICGGLIRLHSFPSYGTC